MTFTTIAVLERGGFFLPLPPDYLPEAERLHSVALRRHSGHLTVTLGTPKRPRSTGTRSQNSRVWGMCQSIAEQLDADVERVYQAMKRMAVQEGYPTRYNPIDGIEEPESQSRVSVEQDSILIRVVQRFADENSLYLVEYVDGAPERTIGGKKV